MDAVDLGWVRCIRAGASSIQVQSAQLGRRWVQLEALHSKSDVWGLGMAGRFVVRRWWAREKRLV